MKGIVIYESLTGNTRKAGELIAAGMTADGIETVACSTKAIDLQALSEADLVVLGTWVDGLFFFGQRPGGSGRLNKLPVLEGKQVAVYVTYALEKGKTLDKLTALVEQRLGGEVIGGQAIRRDKIADQAADFVARVVGAADKLATA